jgi:hypothetical protein
MRQYNAQTGTYQVITDTWWTDKRDQLISHTASEGSSAVYNPVEGYRYEWIMGQKGCWRKSILTVPSPGWERIGWLKIQITFMIPVRGI